MRHRHGIRCRSDIELYRMRRTLKRVVRKLEEALHLSRSRAALRAGLEDERPTAAHRHR
jgi:hypothetical protein